MLKVKQLVWNWHVSKEKLVVIESPLDSLWKQGGIE
jgi:hypothetical protein